MASYHQMGNDTENLVGEKDLESFSGIILSPVNRDPGQLSSHIQTFGEKGAFDIVLDPQLYCPRSDRGKLTEHPYFPRDIDTTDLSSIEWWRKHVQALGDYACQIRSSAVASPAFIPKTWSHEYYDVCGKLCLELSNHLEKKNVAVLSSVVVGINDLAEGNKPQEIASILSSKPSKGYYVVFVSDVDPRRELSDDSILLGMMKLVRELKRSGAPVLVSNCSSDLLLFKIAGADNCASGKFFNLRRFTKSRFEEPGSGGSQIPYWFEHSLLAFLRPADVLRLQDGQKELLAMSHSQNHWGNEILEHLRSTPQEPWVRLGWRHYMSWFARAEADLHADPSLAVKWLRAAEDNWILLEDADILFDEKRNNGSWIRPWRQAISEFNKDAS